MSPETQQDLQDLNAAYPHLMFTANGEIFCVADIVRLEWVADNAGTKRLRMFPTAGSPAFIMSQAESSSAYTKWLTFQVNRTGSRWP